jgi:hypothetical protein
MYAALWLMRFQSALNSFFDELKAIAPQLTPLQCWYRILSEAMKKYLKGVILKPPDLTNYVS